MIVVTGAAGFIGSVVVAALNSRGKTDLILVDHLDANPAKKKNIEHKKYAAYFDKAEFIDRVRRGVVEDPVECIIHMGACSSTTLQDAQYFEENNFLYTKDLAEYALSRGIRFIYASSAATYGDGRAGYDDRDEVTRLCKPLNLYGQSKHKFDIWALDHGWQDKLVGLKFFNVFGPNEYHKGGMRSVVAKAYYKVKEEGVIDLFKSTHPDYKDGEQMRDFIYVKDAVEVVMFFVDHPQVNGIFNVGTGTARTWNDLAKALFSALHKAPRVNYVDMPHELEARYQNFTEAKMDKLKQAGYQKHFMPLEDAVKDYAVYLNGHQYL